MNTNKHIIFISLIIAFVYSLEMTLLAKLIVLSDEIYQAIHLISMAGLIVAQLSLIKNFKQNGLSIKLLILTAVGLFSTGIGDYANSSLSNITPVSTKLTFAMIAFGFGYLLYSYNLWVAIRTKSDQTKPISMTNVSLTIVPVLGFGLANWFMMSNLMNEFDLLYYGSFVFVCTIYLALPSLSILYAYKSGWSISSWIIMIASFFILYSDVILFSSWLVGNPNNPTRELYAYNWIIYFGGQCLMSLLPTFVAINDICIRKDKSL